MIILAGAYEYPLFLWQLEVSIINKRVIPKNVKDDMVNEKIKFKEVMFIDAD